MFHQKTDLGAQFGTALATACRQDGTASAGTHAKAKAVLLGTTAVIRLKSPLAHGSYSKTIKVRLAHYNRGKNRLTLRIRCLFATSLVTCTEGTLIDTKDFTTLGHGGAASQTEGQWHSSFGSDLQGNGEGLATRSEDLPPLVIHNTFSRYLLLIASLRLGQWLVIHRL